MAPGKICIPLGEGWFDNIGCLPDGTQFMAYVTGAIPGGEKYPALDSNLQRQKCWLAVIHLFDSEGNHLQSQSQMGGLDTGGLDTEGWDEAGAKAETYLQAMKTALSQRGEPVHADIWVKLFSVEIEAVVHGLFYEPNEDDPEQDCVMLEPCDVMFHAPWDSGEYST